MRRGAALAALVLTLGGCTRAETLHAFRQTLAQDSATRALAQWCARRGIASPARIEARQVGDDEPATPAIRAQLQVSAGEPLRYRHVELSCGGTVLSDARNWYVPARLTPAMNQTLDTTRIPFGTVAAPLGFHRGAIAADMPCPARTIYHTAAVIRRDDGAPISVVSECYTRANIAPG